MYHHPSVLQSLVPLFSFVLSTLGPIRLKDTSKCGWGLRVSRFLRKLCGVIVFCEECSCGNSRDGRKALLMRTILCLFNVALLTRQRGGREGTTLGCR